MKVLHITQNYYPSLGGTQHTMKKISECLHKQYDDKVTVLTTNSLYGPNNAAFKKIEEKEVFINGVHVKRFGFLRAHKPVLKFMSRASIRLSGKGLPDSVAALSMGPYSASMKNAIAKTDADVICASSVHYRFADYGIYRKHIANPKPFVLYGALHLETEQVHFKYIERIKASDHYIANTLYEKEFLIKQGMPAEKITVAGAATDILEQPAAHLNSDVLRQLNIEAGKKIILCISRQEAFKGLPVLLDAFKQLQQEEKNNCLIIAGAKGTYSSALQQAVNEIKDLHILTDISQETKCALLQAADLVVLPSKEESFGVVFLEAWSFKKPVIGARIGAIASLITEDKDGYLFTPGNAAELAVKIRHMLAAGNNIQMGEAGYEKVQQFYTWNKITATFRHAYLKAIEDFNQQKN